MKHFLKVIAFGAALGLVLVVVQQLLRIETGTFLRGYFIGAATILAAAAVCNILYNLRFRKKIQQAALLLEEGKPDEYITAVEQLVRTARGRQLKNLLRLNLTAGYCDKKEYSKAIALLEELEDARLQGAVRMIQRLNLCLCYFYTGRDDRAMAVYDASDALFAPYRGGAAYGKNLAVVDMLADIQKGRYDDVRQLLETARKNWNNPRIAADYDYIEKLLEEKTAAES